MTERRPLSIVRELLESAPVGGLLLMLAAVAAMIAANSGASELYQHAVHLDLGGHSLLHWINDGLMALFFLLVGLEVKREWLDGELATPSRRVLPGAAAIAGMAVPALIYVAFNWSNPATLKGWAIPAATDIAFALAVLALLGSRAPASLKILLTAIAIIDDLGAILIIALFYTASLDFGALGWAAAGLAVLIGLNRLRVGWIWLYLLIGVGVWWAVLQSGIHATLAGVAVALTVPLSKGDSHADDTHSPLHRLEHGLQPLVTYLIVPVFGFFNAGVDLRGLTLAQAASPVPLGVAVGLVAGKAIGVSLAILLLVRLGLASRPAGAGPMAIAGLATLCGIGFTMSLFIAGLAFGEGSAEHDAAKLGVLAGTVLAALLGWLILSLSAKRRA